MLLSTDVLPVQYSIVKFLPDIIRDEPINVGIIASVQGRLVLRALPKFGRVRRAAGISNTSTLELGMSFLRSTIDREPELSLTSLVESSGGGILRLSDVLGGLADDPWEFIDEQYDRYVGDMATPNVVPTTTRRTIREHLRAAIAKRGINSSRFAISKTPFKGLTGNHDFDFGFENGKVTLLRGISLQTDESYALRDARELSFAAIDSHRLEEKTGQKLEVIAIVAPPTEANGAYDEAYGLIRENVDRNVTLDSYESDIEITQVLEPVDVRPLSPAMLAKPSVASLS